MQRNAGRATGDAGNRVDLRASTGSSGGDAETTGGAAGAPRCDGVPDRGAARHDQLRRRPSNAVEPYANALFRAWKLGGSLVAVSGLDGAGGYENEGQSLTVIDVADGFRRRVVADYFAIVRVELLDVAGHRGLLVHMRDGGRGSLHVTVVDPKRGQVFRARNALGRLIVGGFAVSGYGDSDEAVVFGDKRTPLRIDTIPVSAIDTLGLLVVPRAP